MERVGSWLGNNGIQANLDVTHTPAAYPAPLCTLSPYISVPGNR